MTDLLFPLFLIAVLFGFRNSTLVDVVFFLLFFYSAAMTLWAGLAKLYRKPLPGHIRSSFVILVITLVWSYNKGVKLDSDAQILGFHNYEEQKEAEKAGFTDAEKWRPYKEEREKTAELARKSEQEVRAVAEAKRRAEEEAAKLKQEVEEVEREEKKKIMLALPVDEVAFVKVVESAREKYTAGATELAQGAARPWRAKLICSTLRSTSVSEWVGKVSVLSTNSRGKGVFSVEISHNVNISTWNNFLSDIGSDTLIEPDSRVYASLLSLKVDDLGPVIN
jgi:hypothetical protein